MNSQIYYLIGEAFRGWRQHRLVILPSLIIILLCSLVLSFSLIFLGTISRIQSEEAELFQLEAFLENNLHTISDSAFNDIASWKAVEEVDLITPEEALAEFSAEFGEDMLQLVDENPLPASLRISLQEGHRNTYTLKHLSKRLQSMPFIQEVRTSAEMVDWLEERRFDFVFWPVVLVVALIGTLWLIIANAVRLTLFSRRLLVDNMKYAGGSSFFIQFPFVLEGVLQGLLGASSAALISYLLLSYIRNLIPIFARLTDGSGILLLGMVLVITALGGLTSFRTVRSFLREES